MIVDPPINALTEDDLPVTFGRYVLERVLGVGGMARVFQAELQGPAGFKKTVALKVIGGVETQYLDQVSQAFFLREARLGALLRHPNLVDVYELGKVDEIWFIAMEWVDGLTLEQLLHRSGPLPPSVFLEVALDLCEGLEDAHKLEVDGARAGLVHRDLKPSNVLIGWKGVVKISDFGIARISVRLAGDHGLFSSGGSPRYMSPEQWRGAKLDHRSDIFALGCVLYAMATSRHLFEDNRLAALEASALDIEVLLKEGDALETLERYLPGLGAAVYKCLRLEPADRHPSVESLGACLRLLGSGLPTPSLADWLRDVQRPKGSESADIIVTREAESSLPTLSDLPIGLDHTEARRTNLRADPNLFVGRQHQCAELADLFLEGHRLVTLVGPPGTGKTRLAKHFGFQSLERGERESVWFCDLSQASAELDVLSAVATVLEMPLNLSAQRSASTVTILGDAISRRGRLCLVLDNAEQVIEALSSCLEKWWDQSPSARFLVTSRRPLGLEMEQQLQVPPLTPPHGSDSVETIADNHAVRLFVSRARALTPSFRLDADNAQDIAAIVRALDGLPLALELAASRTKMLTPEALRGRLGDRFRLLKRPRSEPRMTPRQTTLRAALDWSWALLEPWEKSALAQCSVFRGGFSWEDVEAVVDLRSWQAAPWVIDVVASLVDHSLVMVKTGTSGQKRLSLLVSVAEYAAEKLEEDAPDLSREVALRHRERFARHGSEAALNALDENAGVQRRTLLLEDLPNIIGALESALAADDAPVGVATFLTALTFWRERGPFAQARAAAQKVARLTPSAEDRARLLIASGRLAPELGLEAKIEEHYQEEIASCRDRGDHYLEARITDALAVRRARSGAVIEARALFDRAVELFEVAGHCTHLSMVFVNSSILYRRQGEVDRASIEADRALEAARRAGNRKMEAISLIVVANICGIRSQLDEAFALKSRALKIMEEVGDRRSLGRTYGDLGNIHSDRMHLDDAQRCYQKALSMAGKVGDRHSEGLWTCTLANLELKRGDNAKARDLYGGAIEIFRELRDSYNEGLVQTNLALALGRMGEEGEALELFHKTLEQQRERNDRLQEARTARLMGHLLWTRGELAPAAALTQRALELFTESGEVGGLLLTLVQMATMRLEEGSKDLAQALMARGDARLIDFEGTYIKAQFLCGRALFEVKLGRQSQALVTLSEVKGLVEGMNVPTRGPLAKSIAALESTLE